MKKPISLYLLLIAAACLVVYTNTFRVPFQFDDLEAIQKNPALHSVTDIASIWRYWPTRFITYLSFALNYQVHGLSVFGYHAVNLLIHLVNSLLVFLIVRNFLRRLNREEDSMALFAGLIFAVHPVQTQAVTYIYQRSTSLATLFILLSLYFYFTGKENPDRKKSLQRYLLTAGSALAGMFTKEIAIVIPFLLLLVQVFLFQEDKFQPFPVLLFLLLLPVVPLTAFATRLVGASDFQKVSLVTAGSTGVVTRNEYLFTQFRGLLTYLRLLVVPINQNLDYDYPVSTSLFQPGTLAGLAVLLMLLAAVVFFYRRNRLLSLSIGWFLLTLAPQSSFLPKPDLIVEHRLYLPCLGYSLFLPAVVLGRRQELRRPGIYLLILISGLYAVLAFGRNMMWRSRVVLWDETVKRSPDKARAYLNRGLAYEERGAYNLALKDYTKALQLQPDYTLAHLNRGVVLAKLHQFDLALTELEKVRKLKPESSAVANNYGVVLAMAGKLHQAVEEFSLALTLNPQYPEAYRNRGISHLQLGNLSRAIDDFSAAISLDRYQPETYHYRAIAYCLSGKEELARKDWNKFQRLTGKKTLDVEKIIQMIEKAPDKVRIEFNAW
ncbi:MAG TPA: tetratricopeptide repeat protein [bacterium]|nr:tetratricopeptide repeat protein [bacterium]